MTSTADQSHGAPSGPAALERHLASLDPASNPDAWAVAAYRLGVALSESANDNPQAAAQRALSLFSRASALFDVDRAPLEHARIVNAAGAVWRSLGDRQRATDAFRRAAELMEGRARDEELGAALSNLGLSLAESGDGTAAVAMFERALAVLRPQLTPSDVLISSVGGGANHGERRRAFAAAALNLAQALLAEHGQARTGAAMTDRRSLAPAFAAVSDGLTAIDPASAPLQFGMLEHTRGLLWMEVQDFGEAHASFGRSLAVFTRSTFPFQHAIASFNRARAAESTGAFGSALLDYEAAAQVFDPRLHRPQWLEAASRLSDVESRLRLGDPTASRHDHIVAVLVAATPTDRANLLRERLTRLLAYAPMPQRSEFVLFFAAVQRLTDTNVSASDALLRQTIEILMELPDELLESALLGLLEAESSLSPDVREAADRRLDTAIQELLMGPQRMRMRDILYDAGWVRP